MLKRLADLFNAFAATQSAADLDREIQILSDFIGEYGVFEHNANLSFQRWMIESIVMRLLEGRLEFRQPEKRIRKGEILKHAPRLGRVRIR